MEDNTIEYDINSCSDALEQKAEDTTEIVGVKFRENGKTYYFDPCGSTFLPDEKVIVETARGVEYGFITIGNSMVGTSLVVPPLRPVLRKANDEDNARYEANKKLEADVSLKGRIVLALLVIPALKVWFNKDIKYIRKKVGGFKKL